jgi:predicted anti-sigma-YlaC factor YlaD
MGVLTAVIEFLKHRNAVAWFAIDPDAVPNWRLVNTLAQEKARWLLDHSAELFLDFEETQP